MKKQHLYPLLLILITIGGILYFGLPRRSGKPDNNSESIAPEHTVKVVSREIVHSTEGMVVTANPYASEAAMEILCSGGSALDAAIAAQLMLTLVEPQSSGIGGGAFILYYDKKNDRVFAYDGRETTPKNYDIQAFYDKNGNPKSLFDIYSGGLSVGVPGVLSVMDMAHKKHGKLPWKTLFAPAIRRALNGFKVSSRLHGHLKTNERLKNDIGARNLYFKADGSPVAFGEVMTNPEIAHTFQKLSLEGITPFYLGEIAQAIVNAVANSKINVGKMELSDLLEYEPIERTPISMDYRNYKVVGFPPPSSGCVTVLQILGILNFFNLSQHPLYSPTTIQRIAEASNIAFADRDVYLADPEYEDVPVQEMLNRSYLESRAKEIPESSTGGIATPGIFLSEDRIKRVRFAREFPSTTQISIIDAEGNAVSMTSSIEQAFGSGILVRGFFLNNHLTDFTFENLDAVALNANRISPGKRPRSSMSPTLVFNKKSGDLKYVLGSPGGARIISYVTKVLLALIDYKYDIQQAIAAPNFSSRNGPLELEKDTFIVSLKSDLEKMGYTINVIDLNSGVQGIDIKGEGRLTGGADPRRDSLAIGGDWCRESE